MKLKLTLAAAFVATLVLTACGSSDNSPVQVAPLPPPPVVINDPAALVSKDTVLGTGAEAAIGKGINVHYTGWLYDSTKPDNKGTQFESTVGKTPVAFMLTKGTLIEGWTDGIPGMKAGGKRTLTIPSSKGYGTTGKGPVPANTGMVFDIELISVN
ncbi:FKBP-type peptidyl-prolyl cis-trans isomerase [Massilia sp. CCM 8733]|uniref:Peptidyl-prolyl cis-trans isomerase n=1 Tax=Massilia mucilaginosa TaxID=2609282 RepID=A0ABX0NT95_9BURK|nr:FKBP-type peptidyl-prolyl cis-trans isomerase [Massilia mucilaginosa]NHZ90144.1 FKBP-type peptidyl-prolyl cis-trans isomerase [Massilia mucilaginosa]